MNKILAMLLLTAALFTGAFGLTACSDDSEEKDTSSDTETDVPDGGDEDGGDADGGDADAGK